MIEFIHRLGMYLMIVGTVKLCIALVMMFLEKKKS
jgi:hypothetical protein